MRLQTNFILHAVSFNGKILDLNVSTNFEENRTRCGLTVYLYIFDMAIVMAETCS